MSFVTKFFKDYLFYFLLRRYYGKDVFLFFEPFFYDTITTKQGLTYKVSEVALADISSSLSDYDFSDIRKDDVVLDIGAGHGGFTLPAARQAKHVYAVEPLFCTNLQENLALNNINNVTVLPFALGDGTDIKINYGGVAKLIKTVTFPQLIQQCGDIDFLKCDCEGGEWLITPEMLKGIRRLEFELHATPDMDRRYVEHLIERKYKIKTINGPNDFAYLVFHGYYNDDDTIIDR